MRIAGPPSFIALIGVFWTEPAAGAPVRTPPTVDYVYVEANEGTASGGHAALKFDRTVYQFQHWPDGVFRLVRQDWERFRYAYNALENRTLHVARIEVDRDAFERIQDRLARHLLIQNRHLEILATLRADRAALTALDAPDGRVRVRGAGLFSDSHSGSRHGERLRAAARQRYGPRFPADELDRLEQALRSLRPQVREARAFAPAEGVYPRPQRFFSDDLAELLLRRESLRVLERARPLAPDALLDPVHFALNPAAWELSKPERVLLERFGRALERSVLELIGSRRPDRGYPLLVAIARYHAVMRSLELNRLLLLDPFPDDAILVTREAVRKKRALVAKLARRARRAFEHTRARVFAQPRLEEPDYNALEASAGRYRELRRGAALGAAVRAAADRLVPARSREVGVAPFDARGAELGRQIEAARDNESFYARELRALYDYHLIRKNCVTELFRTMNSAFDGAGPVTRALGGHLAPGEALSFVPFVSFHRVTERFRVREIAVLPSHRKRWLGESYRSENPARVYLREFNTLSSSLYEGAEGDSAFLLFTDDVFWPRPLYGLVNLGYGLAHAGVGLFAAPVDGGRRVLEGLRGALFSLPELFFSNIRKGSFEFVDEGGWGERLASPARR